MSKGYFCYDVEVSPNFFCVTFMDIFSKQVFCYVIHESRDERSNLVEFIKSIKGLISFNGLFYDSPILRFFMQGYDDASLHPSWAGAIQVTDAMFAMSGRLINSDWNDDQIRQLRYPYQSAWSELDLMKLMAFDRMGISLKQCAINLRWPRIIDLPFAYDAVIPADQIAMVLDYNLNDVQITQALFERLQPEIALRKDIKKVYGVDVTSASNSKIANVILQSMLCPDRESYVVLKDKRTKRDSVKIADCIPTDVTFKAPELCQLLVELQGKTVYRAQEYQYKFALQFAGKKYQLGIGGLHSDDAPGDFKSSEHYHLRDADVSSYYPAIMLKLNIRPAHLDENFSRVLKQMTEDRLKAKRDGDTTRAAALKITINSIFGKLNSETFWLEDAKAFLSVTIAGQLYLLMLIEQLAQAGIQTISANTDGICCLIQQEQEVSYQEITRRWQKQTGFELEFSDYQRLVRRDVNNYLAIKLDGKTKEKGVFAAVTDLTKGMKMPIVQKCLYEYFAHGQTVEQTIAEDQDIYDYAISQKTGGQFKLEYRTVEKQTEEYVPSSGGLDMGGEQKKYQMIEGITLQKNNRFCVARQGGALVKVNVFNQKETRLYAGHAVRLLNDIQADDSFESYSVDLDFYIQEVQKIIQTIEPRVKQMALF